MVIFIVSLEDKIQQTHLLSAPSTAYQFRLGPEFAMDHENTAGYRIFDVDSKGTFKTKVRRLAAKL